jgi:hypothetical protein
MTRRRAIAIAAALALCLSGCALPGFSSGKPARPTALYSAAAGVELHHAPDAASEVVGTLGRHEGVLRYQLEGGFAYVTSEKTGRSGWVREGQLIETLPVAKKAPEPEAIAAPAAETPAEPAPEPEPPPAPREKSVFDPY